MYTKFLQQHKNSWLQGQATALRGISVKRFSAYQVIVFTMRFLVCFFCLSASSSNAQQDNFLTLDNTIDTLISEPIRPIPLTVTLDSDKVQLGQRLFRDPQLSRDNTVACISCHDLENGGTDHLKRPIGIGGAIGDVNTLTVFNSANNFALFWDGRAETLEDQIDGPLNNPKEMGFSWEGVIKRLEKDASYVAEFARIYPQGITTETIKDAIATFERSLVTPNSRFDQYLHGDSAAITDDEKRGYQNFKSYGCIACHQGMNVGGNMFQIFGVMADYFADRGDVTKADFGRFNVTGNENDRHRFRVPSLRNVAKTAPYFHDGSAETLEQAIMIMARYQLGRTIPLEDVALIEKFLHTLSGEYHGEPL